MSTVYEFVAFSTDFSYERDDRLIALSHPSTLVWYNEFAEHDGVTLRNRAVLTSAFEIPHNETPGAYVRKILHKYPNLIMGIMPDKSGMPFNPCHHDCGQLIVRAIPVWKEQLIVRAIPVWKDSMEFVGAHQITEFIHHNCRDRELTTPTNVQCECGGEKANTTHSTWCPKFK